MVAVSTVSAPIIDVGATPSQRLIRNTSEVDVWIEVNERPAVIPVPGVESSAFRLAPGDSITWAGSGTVEAIAAEPASVEIETI